MLQPFDFDLGRVLQLVQSILLIVTFFWALNERRQNRMADKFAKFGVEYATKVFDDLYSDTRKDIETAQESLQQAGTGASLPYGRLISAFQKRLFHSRTSVIKRLECFRLFPVAVVGESFDALEDSFSLAMANPSNLDQPEVAAAEIALTSSSVLKILFDYELSVTADGSDVLKRIFKEASRSDWD